MKCRQVRELMGAYLYGDLHPDEMKMVRLHAQECADCREDLATRGRVISLVADAAVQLTDEEKQQITWSVAGAIKKQQREQKPSGFRLAPAFALAGALLVVGIGVGGYVGVRMTKAHPPPSDSASAPGGSPSSAVVRVVPSPHPQREHEKKPPADRNNLHRQTAENEGSRGPNLIDPAKMFPAVGTPNGSSSAASRGNADREHTRQIPPDKVDSQKQPQKPDTSADSTSQNLPRVDTPNDAREKEPE